ncbi:MAG: hypothetical protein J2P14_15125, partial [Acidothermales bacterium]|nr:hypothetical protein [Acidothermales bacterium]
GVRSADAGTNAEADVRALARLAGELLGPAPPRAVAHVLRDAGAGRHTATSFAGALLDACRPEPVRVPGVLPAGALRPPVVVPTPGRTPHALPPRHRRVLHTVRDRLRRERLPRARVVVVATSVVAPLLLLGCVALWVGSRPADPARPVSTDVAGSRTPASPSPPAVRTPTPSAWRVRLGELDRTRASAYARGDPAALRRVYVAGSRALATDTATLRRYVADGVRVRDVRLEVSTVSLVRRSARTAVLAVTDRLGGYDVLDAAGRVVRHEPGRGKVRWRITLRNVEGRWLIADSRRA